MALLGRGDWGDILVEDEIERCGNSVKARAFLENVIVNAVKSAFQFYVGYNKEDYPFRYDERRMASLYIAAVDKITPVHLSEYPVRRLRPRSDKQKSKEYSNGGTRVDLWCHYNNVDILLEFKRSYGSPDSIEDNNRILLAWRTLKQQLQNIKDDLDVWSNDYIRIGILTVFVFQSNKSKDLSSTTPQEIFREGRQLIHAHDSLPWSAAWVPPSGPIVCYDVDSDGNRSPDTCPVVLFFAKLIKSNDVYS